MKAAWPSEIWPVNPVKIFNPWQVITAMPTSIMMEIMYLEAASGYRMQASRKTINQARTNQVWKMRSSER